MRMAKMAAILLVCLTSLVNPVPARAMPPLPSSFYGTVKINNMNVPDGTLVQALIDGQVFGEIRTTTYQGGSIYALDVRGDDSTTTEREGGREGETIQFRIGNILTGQTGTWHTGITLNINLSVQSSTPLATPPPTLTPQFTQTAIHPPSATPFKAKTSTPASINSTPGHDPATPFNPAQFIPRSQTAAPTSGHGAVLVPASVTPSAGPASQIYTVFKSPTPLVEEDAGSEGTRVSLLLVLLVGGLVSLAAWWFLRKK